MTNRTRIILWTLTVVLVTAKFAYGIGSTSANVSLASAVKQIQASQAIATSAIERAEEASVALAASEASATSAVSAIEQDLTELAAENARLQGNATPPAQAKSSTKTAPNTSTTKRAVSSGAAKWRPLVATYFKGNADAALRVMSGESGGNPNAKNGPCWGLFQIDHEIHAKKIAEKAKVWGMKADLFDPEFNIRFAAYMSAGGTNWSSWTVQP